jgi:DNA-binding MarR family transcriptional regulator
MVPVMDEADGPGVGKTQYEALAAFRHVLRRFLVFSEAAAAAEGIPAQQHQALLAIAGHPDGDKITIGALADALMVKHNTAVELSDRLAAAGLITRLHAPEDRRRILLSLTPKAEAALTRLSAAHLTQLRRAAPELIRLLSRF